ncbi:exopolysaccharide biosynthesis protein [uncultured Albimonas sp.]|uniref:exopolysaccharide biosynthesis protein n=1 Tax=uncultured Albimonas sp. TaxID=1331701 RepID=UPI0030EBF6BB|tara:strand:- start:1289 stop:1903 length:615 start_codon:yes stop_codon:yes gene_type:complete
MQASGGLGRPSLVLSLLRAVNVRRGAQKITVGEILEALGERSFGWTMLLFAIVNMLPLPIGSTLLTAIPLIILSLQLTLGRRSVALPRRVMALQVSRQAFRRGVHRLRPVMRAVERVLKPRFPAPFAPGRERLLGALLLLISVTLFLPIPLSAWGPAISLLICAFGLIEQDGLVLLGGLAAGAISIAITVAVVLAIVVEASILL